MKRKLSASVRAARKKPGGSNVGKYKGVKEFAGPSGGSPKGSFPIDTEKHAIAALALAHNAPDPEALKAKVYRKWPKLKESAEKRGKLKKSKRVTKRKTKRGK